MNFFYRILALGCLFYPFLLLNYYGKNDSRSYQKITINWYHDIERNQLLRNRSITNHIYYNRKFFYNKKNLVYFNNLGEALHKISVDSKTLISPDNDYYIVYPRLSQKVELFNKLGEKQWSLDTYAIPFITPFRKNIVLLSSDHNTLTVYDNNRNLILTPSYLGSLITDYAVCKNNDGIIIGNSEGDIYFFNSEVKEVFKNQYQDSRYNYIKSVACSSSGNYFLTLDGLDPEWITLLDQKGNTVWRKTTGKTRKTKSDIFIDEMNGMVIDPQKNEIDIYSLNDGEIITKLLIADDLSEIKRVVFASIPGLILLGINGKNNHKVILLNNNLEIIWENSKLNEYLTYIEFEENNNNVFFLIQTVFSMTSYQVARFLL